MHNFCYNNGKVRIADLLLEKFISEEIMTKSELDARIDAVMDKLGTIITTGIGLAGLMVALLHH